MNLKKWSLGIACLTLSAFLGSCGSSSGSGANLPLVTPPVKTATPAGLGGGTTSSLENLFKLLKMNSAFASPISIDPADFKSRFFSTAGPTQVLSKVLPDLDSAISTINTQTKQNGSACLSQNPVSYTITPFNQTITMYAQCYNKMTASYTGDPAFSQFGVKDGVTYIYVANGAEWYAAIVTPITGASGQYTVQAWIGLGYSNTSSMNGSAACSTTWDGCSYGLMELTANSSTKSFEFAVAGMGFGYCGAQIKSDGTNIYFSGSVDQGSTCGDAATLCVAASDAKTTSTCGTALSTFSLQSLGRKSTAGAGTGNIPSTWAASGYPASGGNITLDGSSTDAIHFGPTSPTSGVGKI